MKKRRSPFLKSSTLGMPCRCRTGHRQTLDAAISPRHPWIQNRHETCHVVMMCCLLYISSNATSIDFNFRPAIEIKPFFCNLSKRTAKVYPKCVSKIGELIRANLPLELFPQLSKKRRCVTLCQASWPTKICQ